MTGTILQSMKKNNSGEENDKATKTDPTQQLNTPPKTNKTVADENGKENVERKSSTTSTSSQCRCSSRCSSTAARERSSSVSSTKTITLARPTDMFFAGIRDKIALSLSYFALIEASDECKCKFIEEGRDIEKVTIMEIALHAHHKLQTKAMVDEQLHELMEEYDSTEDDTKMANPCCKGYTDRGLCPICTFWHVQSLLINADLEEIEKKRLNHRRRTTNSVSSNVDCEGECDEIFIDAHEKPATKLEKKLKAMPHGCDANHTECLDSNIRLTRKQTKLLKNRMARDSISHGRHDKCRKCITGQATRRLRLSTSTATQMLGHAEVGI